MMLARSPRRRPWPLQGVLDVSALLALGLMLVRFAVTGDLFLLLHPDYMILAHLAAVLLLGLAVLRGYGVLRHRQGGARMAPPGGHLALLPRRLSTLVLLAIGLFGLVYSPQPFTSDTAFQRGITDVLGQTRTSPQRFVGGATPEERTIIDWVRTLNVYPEPDAYAGQPIRVSGFVVHLPDWPLNYFMISRFVLTCCAADAYPVGLPVQLPEGQPRPTPDTWLEVEGMGTTTTLDGQRQLAIAEAELTPIPEPRNPYQY